ncbi:MAG: hypothetical protein ACTSUI_02195 [Promethearchaeota archaeon]
MICLGNTKKEKNDIILDYCNQHDIKKVFILSPKKFYFNCSFRNYEFIEYADIIEYIYFYRLLQEIDKNVLIVINECLRTQNRYDLTYNCIRNFLNQTNHQIIFQYLPFIDTFDDFYILFDFDTRSKWKREKSEHLLKESKIKVKSINVKLNKITINVSEVLHKKYYHEKNKLFNNLGLKDPHTIPRNLYLISGKFKLQRVDPIKKYIGRNNRFKLDNLSTYKEISFNDDYTVFEFCHNFIDFSDFLTLSRQTDIDVLVSDLKVDQWYFERFEKWIQRIANAYSKI